MKLIILTALLSFTAVANPLKTISYSDELCTCKAQFDPSKISEEKLSNGLTLPLKDFYSPHFFVTKEASAPKDQIIEKLKKTQFEYDSSVKALKAMPLPDGKEWEAYRDFYLRSLEFSLFTNKSQMSYLADGSLSHLTQDFRGEKQNQACLDYAQALKTEESQKAQILKMLDQSCKNNANPIECKKNMTQSNPKGQILAYGWNNCVVAQWGNKSSNPEALNDSVAQLKSKYLKNEKCECDEP